MFLKKYQMNKRGLLLGLVLGLVMTIIVHADHAGFSELTGPMRSSQIEQQGDPQRYTETRSNLSMAAIHEASHTVIALVMGNRIQFTRLTADGTGQTSHLGPADARANAIIALAGCIGEKALGHNTCDGTERDFKIARLKGGRDYLALVPEVEKLIKEHRIAVLIIARELEEKRSLNGRRTRQLFKEAEKIGK